MEDIFKKLCKIAAGIEADQKKIKAKVGLAKHHILLKIVFFSIINHREILNYSRKNTRS